MGYEIQQKFETTGGTVWTKEVDPDSGDTVYRKDGSFASQNSYAAASTHKEAQYIEDGKSTPERPTEIPVPDAEAENDFSYAEVQQRDASAIGMAVNQRDPLVTEYEVNGENYRIDDLKSAFRRAQQAHQQPVRYLK